MVREKSDQGPDIMSRIQNISFDPPQEEEESSKTTHGDAKDTCHSICNTSSQEENNRSPATPVSKQRFPSTPIIICDAWYGFPVQKRPRQERILAVSKQINNYIEWNNEFLRANIETKKQSESDGGYAHMMLKTNAIVYVIGKAKDVDSIQERVEHLQRREVKKSTVHSTTTKDKSQIKDGTGKTRYNFMPGKLLEDLCEELIMTSNADSNVIAQTMNIHSTNKATTNSVTFQEKVVYLSPDAEETLSPKELPPSIVVVGMLVDRKVQHDRSKSRAEQIVRQKGVEPDDCKPSHATSNISSHEHGEYSLSSHLHCARLPLDALNVSDLGSDEALNIDTVLEMVQRWWFNNCQLLDIVRHNGETLKPTPTQRKESDQMKLFSNASEHQLKLFKDAACRALLTHRNRHPNRTIHCPR